MDDNNSNYTPTDAGYTGAMQGVCYLAVLAVVLGLVWSCQASPSHSRLTTNSAPCGEKPPPHSAEKYGYHVGGEDEADDRKSGGSHVINGDEAAAGSWPWMASVQFRDEWTGTHYHVCGGVLVAPRWMLTAAHCVDEWVSGEGRGDHTRYRVMLGGHDLYEMMGIEQFTTLDCFVKHDEWYPDVEAGLPNDIALLKLSDVADLVRENIGVVCLPDVDNDDYENEECWVSGWGITEQGAEYPPNQLHEGKTTLMGNEVCNQMLPFEVLDTHICAGAGQRPNACEGDSGGPLSCRHFGSETWDVAGVSSWGFNFCDGAYPSVFTRVSKYNSWITETIEGSQC